MPNLPFTLRQLDVFEALCETMSFRKAADAMGISQASVSNQIKTLENQLGFRLFARPPGLPPSLTREGLAFLSDLEAFHQAVGRLAAHRRSIPGERQAKHFNILVAVGIMERYIRPKLEPFLVQHQSIDCDFVTKYPRATPLQAIAEGQYDFALYHVGENAVVPEGQRVLARIETGIIGHSQLVAGRTLPLNAKEVSDLPMVLPPKSSKQCQHQLSMLALKGIIPRNVVSYTQYYEVMAQIIEQGVGIGVLPLALFNQGAQPAVSQIFPLMNWRLLWYRKPQLTGREADEVEQFMQSAVLADPDYANTTI